MHRTAGIPSWFHIGYRWPAASECIVMVTKQTKRFGLLIVVCLAVGVVVVTLCVRSKQPAYGGRALGYWFNELPLTIVRPGSVASAEQVDLGGRKYRSPARNAQCFAGSNQTHRRRWIALHILQARSARNAARDRGRDQGLNLAPPSEPDRRISRIRLSSQWVRRATIVRVQACSTAKDSSPCWANHSFGQR